MLLLNTVQSCHVDRRVHTSKNHCTGLASVGFMDDYIQVDVGTVDVVLRSRAVESESEGILGGVGVGKNVATPTSI
jgi:hypothetical protein